MRRQNEKIFTSAFCHRSDVTSALERTFVPHVVQSIYLHSNEATMNGNACAPLHTSLYLKLSSFVLIRLFMFLFHFVEEIKSWPTIVERIFEHTSARSTYMLLTLGSFCLSFALNVIWYFARVPSNTLGHLLYCLPFEIKYKMNTLFEEGNGNKNESQNEKKKKREIYWRFYIDRRFCLGT